MTRLAAGAILGAAFASPALLAAAAQVAPLCGIAHTIGRVLGLIADALLGGTDELP